MLPKQKRLSQAEFSRFFASAKRLHTSFGQILYVPYEVKKASVVVSKKVYKKAVDRNHLRRQLYHLIRDWFTDTDATGVYILITKPQITTLTLTEIKEELYRTLKKTR